MNEEERHGAALRGGRRTRSTTMLVGAGFVFVTFTASTGVECAKKLLLYSSVGRDNGAFNQLVDSVSVEHDKFVRINKNCLFG